MVEVGGDIDHVNGLFGVGCCRESQDQGSGNCQEVTIQHSLTQHLAPSTQLPIYPPTICRVIQPAFVHPAIHASGVHSTIYPHSIHPLHDVHPSTRSSIHATTVSTQRPLIPLSTHPASTPPPAVPPLRIRSNTHPSHLRSFPEGRSAFHSSTVHLAPHLFRKYLSSL